jgi:hypothetical protein
MGDMREAFDTLREHTREQRQTRHAKGVGEIVDLPGTYRVKQLSDYQFRINATIDVFPTNRRFHHLPSNTRGRYTNLRTLLHRWGLR